MTLSMYFIKGFMVGFEMIDSDDYGKFIVLDLGIVRFYLEYDIEE